MKYKKIMIISFLLLLIMMVGAVSASSDMETLSQGSTDTISVADNGIVADNEEECIFYSEGHININDEDADTQSVMVAQFLSNTAGNISLTDLNGYELIRKDVGQVLEDEEYTITYGEIKNIKYLTTPENILYLNFYNSDGVKSGFGSFWVQNDESGFGFDPYDTGSDVEFVLPDGPVNPSNNDVIISIVSSKELEGYIDIFDGEGTPIEENMDIDSLEEYTYDDKFGYKIKSNVFNFTELQDGEIIKFFYYGFDGAFYAEEFRLVIDDPETSVYFERINGTDYPEFYIEREILTNNDNPVAALYIPHNDGKATFPGYVRVYSPDSQNPIFEEYIGENYDDSSFIIYLSDVNYFNGFNEGDTVEFAFVSDEAYLNERRSFHINGGKITLDFAKEDTSLSMVFNAADKELVSTLTDNDGHPIVGASVIVSLDGVNTTLNTNDDGQVIVSTADLASGTYTASVFYNGNDMYNPSSSSIDFAIKENVNISGVYDSNSKELIVSLFDSNGAALKGASVTVKIGSVSYSVKITSSGEGRLSLADLNYGSYTAKVSYKGNAKYNAASVNVKFAVKDDVNLSGVYDSDAKELVVSLVNASSGAALKGASVAVVIDGVDYSVKITSTGEGRLSLADLGYGSYTAAISYKGNAKYNAASANVNFAVKDDVNLSAVYDASTKELVVSLVNASSGAALKGASVAVVIDGVNYSVKITSTGEGRLSLADLDYGSYTAAISYKGNAKYNAASANVDFAVKDAVNLSGVFDTDTKELVVSLVNASSGAALKGASVTVKIGGVSYSVKITSTGEGRLSLADLDYGSYTAKVSYKGNAKFNAASVNVKFAIKDDVNLSAVYDASTKELVVSLVNASSGAALKGASVAVVIDSVDYSVKITSSGEGRLSLADLDYGTYTAAVSYKGNANYYPVSTTAEIIVKDNVNLSAYYDSRSKELVVSLTDAVTGAALKGATVSVNIAGKSANVKIASTGQGRMPIDDLDYGVYATTLSYKGNAKYAPAVIDLNIAVKDGVILSADYDVSTKELVVSLTDASTGDALKGASVSVDIAGEKYTVKINSKGEGRISVADLDHGTYAVTLSYKGNAKYAPSTVDLDVIIKDAVNLSGSFALGTRTVTVTLVDAVTGAALKGASVSVEVASFTYTAKINSTGQGTVVLDGLRDGVYNATLSYKGNANYYPAVATVLIGMKIVNRD